MDCLEARAIWSPSPPGMDGGGTVALSKELALLLAPGGVSRVAGADLAGTRERVEAGEPRGVDATRCARAAAGAGPSKSVKSDVPGTTPKSATSTTALRAPLMHGDEVQGEDRRERTWEWDRGRDRGVAGGGVPSESVTSARHTAVGKEGADLGAHGAITDCSRAAYACLRGDPLGVPAGDAAGVKNSDEPWPPSSSSARTNNDSP
mmetsp:Transcript_1698/g.3499  ORF Transcript_1698/g.3499 Transcript_1698/m.3499 type:complete len:206 (-) Transcript_1698:1274-1891(-)